jgi:hypothetical protein
MEAKRTMTVTIEVANDGSGPTARMLREGKWSEPRRLNYIAERSFIMLTSYMEAPPPVYKGLGRTCRGDAPSPRQRATLEALIELSAVRPPTLRELMTHMGLRTTHWVLETLRALEKKGLAQNHGGSRGWRAVEAEVAALNRRTASRYGRGGPPLGGPRKCS